MSARALRKIEQALMALASEPDPIAHEAVNIAARQIGAQAEMIERGISE